MVRAQMHGLRFKARRSRFLPAGHIQDAEQRVRCVADGARLGPCDGGERALGDQGAVNVGPFQERTFMHSNGKSGDDLNPSVFPHRGSNAVDAPRAAAWHV